MEHSTRPRRVGFIDELRGFDLLLMTAYHAGYDLVFIFGINIPFFGFAMRYIQPVIAGIFIVLAGISCRYSRSNVKRGLKTLALAMVLTVVTLIFIPEESIYFGILHFMGTAMLLYALLNPFLDAIPVSRGLCLSIALFAVTKGLPKGYIGLKGIWALPLPLWLYDKTYLLPLGFAGAGSDYFPLIPHIFMFFSGCYLGGLFISDAMPDCFYRRRSPILAKIGRHTLVIYMLHQPILYGLIWASLKLLGDGRAF